MNYVTKWNKFDSIIFFCENKFRELKTAIADSADTEPDAELMVLAETKYLRSENESLKRRELPVYLIEENGQYHCPKCQNIILDADVKYSSNCGHRVIKHIPMKSKEIGFRAVEKTI